MLCRVFSHLKNHCITEIVVDPSNTSANNSDVERKHSSYSDFSSKIKTKRDLHPKTPTPTCLEFTIVGKLGTDHSGEIVA